MLATLLSAVLSEPSASEMCSNCKVKAAACGGLLVPPQALSMSTEAIEAIEAIRSLLENCFFMTITRLKRRTEVRSVICRYEDIDVKFSIHQKMPLAVFQGKSPKPDMSYK
jgi:hypothetical protein